MHNTWLSKICNSDAAVQRGDAMLDLFRRNLWRATLAASALAPEQQNALNRLVPRKFEMLEVWLLLFCGGYGLLVSIAVVGGARDAALACMAMLCMAIWRRFHPARNQTQWFVSAGLTLLMVAWIYADPRSGGSTGPYLFLLILLSVTYPLLMDTTGATLFAVAILVLYFAAGWSRRDAIGQELFFARSILFAGVCNISWRFGAVLRQAETNIDRLRRDTSSLAYNEHGLARYGGRLLVQCASEAQPCTLVLLPLAQDWHESINVSGKGSEYSATQSSQQQNEALRDMAQQLSQALPAEVVVSRNARGDWVVLVPWMDSHTVLNRLELSFGRPVQLPFGPRSQEMFVALTPCAVVSRGSSDTVELMHARAQEIWLRGVRTGAVN
jgi:uncharacterized membrane protein